MVSRGELEKSIAELESLPPTYSTCERLAWLYIVKDHLPEESGKEVIAVEPAQKEVRNGGGNLAKILRGKNPDLAYAIFDELLETLKLINPRIYSEVIRRLNSI